MILINLVGTFFWQNSLINSNLKSANKLFHFSTYTLTRDNSHLDENDLRYLCKTIGETCSNIALYNSNKVISTLPLEKNTLKQLIDTYENKQKYHSKTGWTWKSFILGWRYHTYFFHTSINDQDHSVMLSLDIKPIVSEIGEKQTVILFYIILNTIFLASIGFFRFSKMMFRPLDKLISLSNNYDDVNDLQFPTLHNNNQISQLSFSLNRMLEELKTDKKKLQHNVDSLKDANEQLIESQNQLIKAEKLAAIGRLSSGLAHEVGNPIGIVRGYMELLLDTDIPAYEKQQFISRSISELDRVDKMIRQLLDYSRSSIAISEPVEVNAVIRDVLELITSQSKQKSINMTFSDCQADTIINVSRDHLYQVLINCILNSIDSIHEHGKDYLGEIHTGCTSSKNADKDKTIIIRITDNGKGITTENLKYIFDPFFTTKDIGKGTGLGLSVSNSIIESMGGQMEVTSIVDEGTTIEIKIPTENLQ